MASESPASAPLSTRRLWLLRALLVVSPLVLLGGIEAAARVCMWYLHGVPGHSYGTSRYDAVLGAAPREHSYNTNSSLNDFGFRNTEDLLDPKPAGSLRVIAYGGSTTYCHQLQNDQAWPIRIQEHLRAETTPAVRHQVLNGGVIMWSIGHVFAKVKLDVPRFHPDYVLIYSGVNEEFNAALLATEGKNLSDLVARGEYGAFTKNLAFNTPFRNVITYKLLQDAIGKFAFTRRNPGAADTDPTPNPVVLENYLQTVKAMIEYLRAEHVTPVFIRELHVPLASYNPRRTAYSAEAAARAAAWGAIVVDPSPILDGPSGEGVRLFQDSGVHYTVAGAQKFADYVYAQVFANRAR